jgi:cytoskeletal protein CcmA (bactofilin family)
MFSKSSDPTAAPAPRNTNARSVLASDLRITGEISSTGNVEILGEVDGNVTAHGVLLGTEGKLSGQITAETVEIKGRLDGKVVSTDFALRSSAKVAADVTYKTLVVDSGAEVEGRFSVAKD